MDKTKTELIFDMDKLGIRVDEIDTRKQNADLRIVVLALKDFMRKNDIIALAANQLGYNARVLVMKFGSNDYRSFVNPIITQCKGFQISEETCHSLPDKIYIRPRYNDITVTYQTPMGKIESAHLLGLSAIKFQHSLDHLDGLLLSDVGFEVDENFDKASKEEKAEIIQFYLDSIDLKAKELQEEIANDKELSQVSEAIDFMTKKEKGEIETETYTVPIESIETNDSEQTNNAESNNS